MTVEGTVLTQLIIEYLKSEEYPEGVPLEAKRPLFQIVEYLKTQRNEKGKLIEISDAVEIKKSKWSQGFGSHFLPFAPAGAAAGKA